MYHITFHLNPAALNTAENQSAKYMNVKQLIQAIKKAATGTILSV